MKLQENYINFISECKTERKCVKKAIELLEQDGFVDLMKKDSLEHGDKVYYNKMGKALVAFKIGKGCVQKGFNFLTAHIDSPRLDFKMNPLYEKDGVAYFNTHYYGGIKKYQWTAIPLSLYGVVCLKNGETIDIEIGDGKDDPVFCISDILPHLADRQMRKSAADFIDPENLDLLAGCVKKGDDDDKDKKNKESAKKNILRILNDRYGIEESDFLSAEIEVVPHGRAHFSGLDKSMILGYGHDDRVCAFASLEAFRKTKSQTRSLALILTDKEEIGSYGATGMNSLLIENALTELITRLKKSTEELDILVRRALYSSYMISADVNAAYDPLNPELFDRYNASYLCGGVVFNKYTGSRGKSGASDANPEFIAKIRKALDAKKIRYQFAELGRVGVGGGGTIALYAAKYGMNVIDSGVAVLSMHAPWEIISSDDLEETEKAYEAFLGIEE